MEHPTITELRDLARETGYQEPPLEVMLRLFGILDAIDRDEFLRDRLALKGGTALNAFHLALPRLSMDIDLEYIGRVDGDGVQVERNVIDGNLSRILTAQNYRIGDNPPGGPSFRELYTKVTIPRRRGFSSFSSDFRISASV